MDFFYDGQIRRYITQFMRIFIGFSYKAGDGTLKSVPVMYGDLSKQVANVIRENSGNKLPSVPRIACYVTALELDRTRLADPTFISKVNIRERAYDYDDEGKPVYQNYQGGGYTVERLMPTPFMLTMRCDIWTSNTDQKLQLLEQMLVLFNPSLEVQTTDNYIDWTSLSTIMLQTTTFSSRSIPQGTEEDIDICTLDFEMPIYISPPVKVKKLGVIQNIIMNMFNEAGDIRPLNELAYNFSDTQGANIYSTAVTPGGYGVLLVADKSVTGADMGTYYVSVLEANEALRDLGLELPVKSGDRLDWNKVILQYMNYRPNISRIRFLQPSGSEIVGTFAINELDPTYLVVEFDSDTLPPNNVPHITSIINPQTFNPVTTFGSKAAIPNGTRYLILEDIGNAINQDGPDGWKGLGNEDLVASANDIIEWDEAKWIVSLDASATTTTKYVTNLRTKIQYKWDGEQWLKSFEGEYTAGYWSFDF